MDHNLSERIALLRFPLIVGIVFLHMYTAEVAYVPINEAANIFTVLSYYIPNVLAIVVVPLFFLLAGYLFFINFQYSFAFFIQKYKSRFRTLVVPYILWNLIILAFYTIAQTLPATAHYFNGERPYVFLLHGHELLELFFGYGKFQYPVAFQFWFIRDLIILVLLSPLIYLALKKIPYLFLSFFAILWIFGLYEDNILKTDFFSTFFFCLGGFLALKKYNFSLSDRYAKEIIILYLIVSFMDLYYQNEILENISVFIGTIAVFTASKYILNYQNLKKNLIKLSRYSFFVFALHEPMLSIVRKVSFKFFTPQHDFYIFVLYIACPVLTIVVSIYVYELLEKILPNILNVLVGNRVSPKVVSQYIGTKS